MFPSKKFGLLLLGWLIGTTLRAQTNATLIPKKGLFLETAGLTWGMGSEINFFTADRKQHHYYFTWWEQDEIKHAPHDTELILGSQNTAVFGSFRMMQTEKQIEARVDCRWNRTDTGLAEITYVRLWKPYFREARWKDAEGRTLKVLDQFSGKKLVAETPFGTFAFISTLPFKIKTVDNPNPTPTDYTARNQYLELYEDKIQVDGRKRLEREFQVETINIPPQSDTRTGIKYVRPVPTEQGWMPGALKKTILPLPAEIELRSGQYTIPLTRPTPSDSVETAFRSLLSLEWQLGDQHHPRIQVVKNLRLHTQEYRIEVSAEGIRIESSTDTALQYALQTLAQATEWANGRLQIPCMKVIDRPKTDWRGIHMFTGPTALDLHTRMYERILLPLKMNKAVIQCEQARWSAFPEIHNPISVSLADLKKEFDLLRKNRVEPIPLIQSLGHMEWFFKPKSTRRLAINPDYPYTLNTDLLEAKEAIRKIWEEAIDLLRPSTLHVGFDEIGMIGFHLPREKEVALFKDQLSFLNRFAQAQNKKLMIWGDMGLAPGEAPDACNGINPTRAKMIRDAIPPGTYVADWHYLNNPDPSVYKKSLQIWKQNQNIPLASPWLWPNNVHGFAKAAIEENAGVLQTTWADFESSEKNMLINIEQFGAYILALDYAWSGRKERPDQLPYDPIREWTKRFYGQSKPITFRAGYRLVDSLSFTDITSKTEQDSYDGESLILDRVMVAGGVSFQAGTRSILPEGSTVAEIEFYHRETKVGSIPLRYGVEIRSVSDRRPIYAETEGQDPATVWKFWEGAKKVDRIRIVLSLPGSGLSLKNILLIE
jgi:hypothetical protein